MIDGVHGFYLVVFWLYKIVSLRVEDLGRIRKRKFGSGFCNGFNGCNGTALAVVVDTGNPRFAVRTLVLTRRNKVLITNPINLI
jgi:hypothetical protein